MKTRYKIVGMGEVLWHMLPGENQLGGAPDNFAYMASMLGDEGIVAGRVGNDPLGRKALTKMKDAGLSTEFLQLDLEHRTGTAVVQVNGHGQPKFTIASAVAWDFMQWTTS